MKAVVDKYSSILDGGWLEFERRTLDELALAQRSQTALKDEVDDLKHQVKSLEDRLGRLQNEASSLQAELNRARSSWWYEEPVNLNGDFSEGLSDWNPHFGEEEVPADVNWGVNVVPGQYGEAFIENRSRWYHVAFAQGSRHIRASPDFLALRGKRFVMEAELMVVEDVDFDPRGGRGSP